MSQMSLTTGWPIVTCTHKTTGSSALTVKLCGFTLLALGLIVLTGWASQTTALIQVLPEFAPMQVNTALGFILCAGILWADHSNRYSILRPASIVTTALADLTLMQYLVGINLGIDELLFDHYLDVKTSHPGRMAPNTALCFLLAGSLGWVRSIAKNAIPQLQGLLAAIPLGLALVTLTGYCVNLETTYGWGNLTRMAIHTAIGFATFSIGMLVQFWLEHPDDEDTESCWWISPAAIAIATLTISLAIGLSQYYQTQSSNFTSYLEWVVLATGAILIATLYVISRITSRRLYSTIKKQIYASYMLFAAGTLGALGFYAWLHNSFEADIENRFLQEVTDSESGLVEGLKGYENTLLEVRDDVEFSQPISDEKFLEILKGDVQRSDHDVIFIWAPKIANHNRQVYEQRLAKIQQSHNIRSEIGISDLANQDLRKISAPTRPFYLPVTYDVIDILESSTWLKSDFKDINGLEHQIRGVDWAKLYNSLPTIAKAIARDGAAATPLTIGGHQLDAIQIILPIYNRSIDLTSAENSFAALDGILIAILSMDRIFSDLIKTINPKGVGFKLSQDDYQIFAGLPDDFDTQSNRLQRSSTVELLGSTWQLTTYAIDDELYPAWSAKNLAPAIILWCYIWFGAIYFWRQSIQHVQQRSHDAYLTALVEAIPTPVYVHDQFGSILLENDAVRQQLPKEVLKDLTTRSNSEFAQELILNNKQGSQNRYIQRCVSFLLPNGKRGTIGILTDVTQLKQAELAAQLAAEYADMIFQKSPVAMVICNRDGILLKSNRTFQQLIASNEVSLESSPIDAYIPSAKKATEELLASNGDSLHYNRETNNSDSLELEAHTVNGAKFPIDMDISLLQSGDSQHIIITIKDITDSINKQAQLLLAKQEADAANRAKSDFLATISHEIRTPMNAIIGMTTLAIDTRLTAKQQDYLDKVSLSAKALLRLINDILDYSKIEANRLELENSIYDLQRDVIEHVANTVSVKAARKKIELVFDIPSNIPHRIYGDALRLNQVLINLLDNAVKFTDEGIVKLKIDIIDSRDDIFTLKFLVIDSGIGMSKEQSEKIFTKFSQADNTITRRFGGTGLGLSICKSLVELMGGNIRIQSEQGVGSSFEFTLDLKSEDHLIRLDSQTSVSDSIGYKRALIVDDSGASRSIISRYLDSFNIENDEAESGESCLTKTKQAQLTTPYDLILMDWKMPNMDGIETIRSLELIYDELPRIIMMTAANSDNLESLIPSDVDVISKPISPSTLLDTLNTASKRMSNMREIGAPTDHKIYYEGVKILLVEDNELNQQVAQEFLAGMGIQSVIATNGQEALDKIEAGEFDAVLMDMQMPVMDGVTATKLIRKNQKFDDVPIIAMTANAADSDRKRCLAAGMNDHIGKPILAEVLRSTLATWLTAKPFTLKTDETSTTLSQERFLAEVDAIEGIDAEEGLNYLDNNEEFYRTMLSRFCDEHEDTPTNLEGWLSVGDFETAERTAHTLKGLARGLGAQRISDLAKDIEQQAAEKQRAEQTLPLLATELEKTIKGIKALKPEPASAVNDLSKQISTEVFEQKLQTIVQGINDWDAATIDVLKDLLSYQLPEATKGCLQELLDPIEQYDFDEASHFASKLESLTLESTAT
ncbi:MAG: hypothetical protein CL693_08300 [Cellvibrionaceae bacterium]|nr:hypothetical protein [Cellvibrionaceae bacterium]|tara:strand:- start:47101 stop:51966 length:4866 start_codon:yes stop_codon:yes gene_type:complete